MLESVLYFSGFRVQKEKSDAFQTRIRIPSRQARRVRGARQAVVYADDRALSSRTVEQNLKGESQHVVHSTACCARATLLGKPSRYCFGELRWPVAYASGKFDYYFEE